MIARAIVLIFVAALSLAASWMLGYREGQQIGAFHLVREMGVNYDSGIGEGRDQVCNEIRRYKFSIAKDLDENTEICGWRDMDKPKNST